MKKYKKFRKNYGIFDTNDDGVVVIEARDRSLLFIETPYSREDFECEDTYLDALWDYIHEEKGEDWEV